MGPQERAELVKWLRQACENGHGHGKLPADCLNQQAAQALEDLEAELDNLHSWKGLLGLLNEHYPAHIFDGSSNDPGPLLIVQVRRAEQAEAQRDELVKAVQSASKIKHAELHGHDCAECETERAICSLSPATAALLEGE